MQFSKFILASAGSVTAVSGAAISNIFSAIEQAAIVSIAIVDSGSTINFVSTMTAATAIETQVVTLMSLPSHEAKKQQDEFNKAHQLPNAAASQVAQALATAGKAVPSAVVPHQPKQTEVKHSGLNDIVNILENADYNQVAKDAGVDPAGFYMKYFNGTSLTVADDYANQSNVRLPITVVNDDKKYMCVGGHVMNTATSQTTPFTFNNTNSLLVPLPFNTTLQIANYLPPGVNNFNGRITPYFNCNKNCTKCAGENQGPVQSLFEHNENQKIKGYFFTSFNPSNVDGMSANFNVTVFNNEGICRRRVCNVSAKQIKAICPQKNLWSDKGTFGCKSECKVTGRDDHCCVGKFGTPETCPPSSTFLNKMCDDAYGNPYDDKTHSDTCNGTTKIHLRFSSIA